MTMQAFLRCAMAALALASAAPARAAGTTPLALVQQFDSTGQPLTGCLVYFFVAGTVATPQQVYQDFGLSQPAPNPLQCDQAARVPQHWLADGLIHVRLTSAAGVVQLDSTLQVLGPSSGGGPGGGPTVDPSAIAATGDIKFRMTNEVLLPFWVTLNGTTIGNGTSQATQRANADTQNLFVYLWGQCSFPSNNTRCPVVGGIGSTALGDYLANRQITLPDMRGRAFVGLDCMGTTCAGRLDTTSPSVITSGGSDGADTPLATGGVSKQAASTTLGQANLPNVNFGVNGITLVEPNSQQGHSHGTAAGQSFALVPGGGGGWTYGGGSVGSTSSTTALGTTGLTIKPNSFTSGGKNYQGSAASGGSATAASSAQFSNMPPFALGTWYMKL